MNKIFWIIIILVLILWGLFKIGSNETILIQKRNEQLNKINDWKEKRKK